MIELIEKLQPLIRNASEIGTVLAALLTVFPVLLGYFFSSERQGPPPKPLTTKEEEAKEPSLMVQSRLVDVKAVLEQQGKIERWSRRANGSLQFGQYIIGGVLATSLVQASLSPGIVSLLGVLVLVSSLVHQHYRPDLRLYGAKRRTVQLKALIRDVEDALYEIEQQRQGATSVFELRKMVSQALSQIEASEVSEYEPKRSDKSGAQPRAAADAAKRRR